MAFFFHFPFALTKGNNERKWPKGVVRSLEGCQTYGESNPWAFAILAITSFVGDARVHITDVPWRWRLARPRERCVDERLERW